MRNNESQESLRIQIAGLITRNLKRKEPKDINPNHFVLHWVGRKLVGCQGIKKIAPNVSYLSDTAVEAAYRKRGIGKLMMQEALAKCSTVLVFGQVLCDNEASKAMMRSAGMQKGIKITNRAGKDLDIWFKVIGKTNG